MAERLNDTDPQSPRAIVTRTDPGLGTARAPASRPSARPPRDGTPAPPTPTPPPAQGSESIDALLDGITGPRPPVAKRDTGPDGIRAYAAARHAPASQPMPPREPLVVSPEPPRSNAQDHKGAAVERLDLEATLPRRPEPFSTRPVVGRAAEERTVYTGRRALLRNLAVLVGSTAVVGMTMMSIMRWKEAHRQRPVSAAGTSPESPAPEAVAPESVETQIAPVEPSAVAAVPAGVIVRGASVSSAAPRVTAAAASASGTKPAASASAAVRRSRPADALDDLNREIRH